MKYSTKTGTLSELKTPCLITSLKQARKVARELGETSLFEATTRDFKDQTGKSLVVRLSKRTTVERLLVVGGADEPLDDAGFRKIARTAAAEVKALPVTSAVWALGPTRVTGRDLSWRIATGLAALSSSLYAFAEHKSKADDGAGLTLNAVHVHTDARGRASAQREVKLAQALQAGVDFARDLGNQPPNVCNPTYLLREAKTLSKLPNVKVSSLDERRMRELGMGAFLSVSQGSDTPGQLIIAQYQGGKSGDAPVVLVGKGITFDTGGISLKPGPNMDEMKFDMCGAASVLGAFRAAAEARLPINLVSVVAAAENMPSGKATRPGDIVRTLSGKTVEILNTDAEGRLVLCDALTYVERFDPRVVIDVATLTGAMIVALGAHASGLFTTDDALAADLLSAGEASGDRAWRMPLWDEYQDGLKSNFADLPNIGTGPGSIVAACFLSRFTRNYRWAHLDVAGSAFQGGAAKGATGRPVGLLFRYLCQQAAA